MMIELRWAARAEMFSEKDTLSFATSSDKPNFPARSFTFYHLSLYFIFYLLSLEQVRTNLIFQKMMKMIKMEFSSPIQQNIWLLIYSYSYSCCAICLIIYSKFAFSDFLRILAQPILICDVFHFDMTC